MPTFLKRTVKIDPEALDRARALAGFVTADQRFRFGKGTSAGVVVLSLAVQRGLEALEGEYLEEAPATIAVEEGGRRYTWFYSSVSSALLVLLAAPDQPRDDLWAKVRGEGAATLQILQYGVVSVQVRFSDRVVVDRRGTWSLLPSIGCTVGSDEMRNWLRACYDTDVWRPARVAIQSGNPSPLADGE